MQNLIWKIAGTVAAVAAAGAAVVFVDKLMQKQQDKIDEMIRTAPETDPEEAPQQPEQEKPVYCAVPEPVGEDRPNPNPVMAKPIETPRTEDGKIDVSKLCDPADFCDWDDLGCQS